jgi:2',3'-cyclic-nucleotide 2'-phosphodiesterase (5'-nucleotidase family)
MSGKVLCSQASYYGIHCGRVDLTFDMDSRKLLERRAFTVLMDGRFELDPEVMEFVRPELDKAAAEMKRKLCTVTRAIEGGGRYSGVAVLFCEAFAAALEEAGTPVDGVFHGTFSKDDIPAGELTVADCWKLLPYENGLITAELTGEELVTIITEDKGNRTLWPFQLKRFDSGEVKSFQFKGQPVDRAKRYRIALNSYDGQSGGRTLPLLHEILQRPASKRAETGVATREALMDFLSGKGEI